MKDKYSAKGVSAKLNKDEYLSVLNSGISVYKTNRGFQFKNKAMYTYELNKRGLTYFYAKRVVLSDGVSTTHLDL